MTQNAKPQPLTDDEREHLRTIRVCGCDDEKPDACIRVIGRTHCPRAELDGIGADWIDTHFDSILTTIDRQSKQLGAARKALTYYATKEYNSRTDSDGQLQFVADEALAAIDAPEEREG